MAERPAIPSQLKREILMEAGHRCAIPACQKTPTEVAHIIPWEQVRKHTFENLIALCPTCHARYDGGEIDRRSMHLYKANLSILTRRYGELEQRVLRLFVREPQRIEVGMFGGVELLLMNLLEDRLIIDTGRASGFVIDDIPFTKFYAITPSGRDFIKRWIAPEELP